MAIFSTSSYHAQDFSYMLIAECPNGKEDIPSDQIQRFVSMGDKAFFSDIKGIDPMTQVYRNCLFQKKEFYAKNVNQRSSHLPGRNGIGVLR
ncbi:hypothetical protein RclHR1_06950006 [Rhizophagus clarus]|uniref:Uncharacterized protein n=1 Tax=Rhizophagus clarus TaxID=94130 RepID=A0A2Z6SAC9_9GLOM|nr:hypothetical protein RclHR1_06950006 [Rhizophagus clarus]